MVRFTCVLVVVLFLAACGGGGGGFDRQPTVEPRPEPVPELAPRAEQAPLIPQYRLQDAGIDARYIGTAQVRQAATVTASNHEGTEVEYGRVPADPSVAQLVRNYNRVAGTKNPFDSPPVVRVRGNQTPAFRDLLLRSVQIINSALPNDFQVKMDSTPYASSSEIPPEGEIRIEMLAKALWSRPWITFGYRSDAWGITTYFYRTNSRGQLTDERASAQVFIDTARAHEPEEALIRVITHELLHAMGIEGHYDNPDASLMASTFTLRPESGGDTIMFALDLWGLRELYDYGSLGSWNTESYQVRACMDDVVCFGTSALSGDAKPWAWGITPPLDIAYNRVLSGNATWLGRLLGLTPNDAVVGGAARLGIDLGTLDGDLDFTGLEYWDTGQAPGVVGSGATWGDGDLTYGVEVGGNTFTQDGTGDEGIVTGMFAGQSHEYMTGVLERDDLAAGFGGKS